MKNREFRCGPYALTEPPSPPRRAPKRSYEQLEEGVESTPFSTSIFRVERLNGETVRVVHSLAYDARASAEWNGRRLGLSPVEIDLLEAGIIRVFVPHLQAKRARGELSICESDGQDRPLRNVRGQRH